MSSILTLRQLVHLMNTMIQSKQQWIGKKLRKKSERKMRKTNATSGIVPFFCIFGRASGQSLKSSKKTTKRKLRKMQKKKWKKSRSCMFWIFACMYVCCFFAFSWPRVFGVALSGCMCLLLCLLHVGLPSSSMIRYLFQYGFMSLHIRQ